MSSCHHHNNHNHHDHHTIIIIITVIILTIKSDLGVVVFGGIGLGNEGGRSLLDSTWFFSWTDTHEIPTTTRPPKRLNAVAVLYTVCVFIL